MRRAWSVVAAIALVAPTGLHAQSDQQLRDLWSRGMDAHVVRKDYVAARAIFDTLVVFDSTQRAHGDTSGSTFRFGNPWLMRAAARRHLRDATGANHDIDRAMQLQAAISSRDMADGLLLQMDGDVRGALAAFERAVEKTPNDALLLQLRATMLSKLGDTASARPSAARAARLADSTLAHRADSARASAHLAASAHPLPGSGPAVPLASPPVAPREEIRDAQAPQNPPSRPRDTFDLLFDSSAPPGLAALLATTLVALVVFVTAVSATRYARAPTTEVMAFEPESGERQLWIGAPQQQYATIAEALRQNAMPFVLLAVAIAVVWRWFDSWQMATVIAVGGTLRGAVFVARDFGRARTRKLTTYALTTKRAIVCVGDRLDSVPIERLRGATVIDHGDGTGTVEWDSPERVLRQELERAVAEGRRPSSIGLTTMLGAAGRQRRGFQHIPDANVVLDKIRAALGEPPSETPVTSAPGDPRSVVRRSLSRALAEVRAAARAPARAGAAAARNSDNFAPIVLVGFAAIGIVLTAFDAVPVISEAVSAMSWESVPCKLLDKHVGKFVPRGPRQGRTRSSWSVDVRFSYQYHGTRYFGDRYQLAPVSVSGNMLGPQTLEGKLNALPPAGGSTMCWVNPGHPEIAVIDRSFMTMGLVGRVALSGAFLLVGIGGLVMVFRERRSEHEASA